MKDEARFGPFGSSENTYERARHDSEKESERENELSEKYKRESLAHAPVGKNVRTP